jgi:ABC-type lipopolysaccharide export system ATPase subunit
MLDEPFSQVMPVHVDTIENIIKEEKHNKGIVITDLLYEHVIGICDEIYVIANVKTYLIKDRNELKNLGYINKN